MYLKNSQIINSMKKTLGINEECHTALEWSKRNRNVYDETNPVFKAQIHLFKGIRNKQRIFQDKLCDFFTLSQTVMIKNHLKL